MVQVKQFSVIVIGAGAGGLVVAIGAAKAGKNVLLIEKGHWGGDCTNFGCIPSKSLIASGEAAHMIHSGRALGLEIPDVNIQAKGALERVRKTIADIRSHEDAEALEKLGVHTVTGIASFEDPHTLLVNGERIQGESIVIAAGSSPFIPPIEGLQGAPYLTNETIFDLEEIPPCLAVLGAGPIGCELAQAFCRLGSDVILIESERGLLPNEESEVSALMKKRFEEEGIKIHVRCKTNTITYANRQFSICITDEGGTSAATASQLLVSTGRRPNVSGLELEKAGIAYTDKGITIDKYGRTSQKHIYAIGDITGAPFFTHRAENQGRTVLTSLILPSPLTKKLDTEQQIPRVTFTDPEIASLGLSEESAQAKFGKKGIAIYHVPFEDVDRAITSGRTEGFIKIVTKKWSSKILGATIAAPRAGEMLPEISLAMLAKIPLRKLARLIHPYPIYNAAIRRCADLWLTQTILPLLRKSKT